MGNAGSNDLIDNRTGMSKYENKLVRDSWQRFCEKNPDYGLALFMAMFSSHPEYLALFPSFKNMHVRDLPNNVKFRAHTREVGQQLTAFITSLDDTDALIEMVRKNAVKHVSRPGVRPHNFESFFSAAMQEIMATNRSAMTAATVSAWEKLFEAMNMITRSVYDEAGKASPKKAADGHRSSSTDEPAAASGASPKARGGLSPLKTEKRDNVSPLAVQSVIRGSHSNRRSFKPTASTKGSENASSTKGASKRQ